jgi:hypothetical protein
MDARRWVAVASEGLRRLDRHLGCQQSASLRARLRLTPALTGRHNRNHSYPHARMCRRGTAYYRCPVPVIPHEVIAAMQEKRRRLLPAGTNTPKTASELRLYVDRCIFAKVDRSDPK